MEMRKHRLLASAAAAAIALVAQAGFDKGRFSEPESMFSPGYFWMWNTKLDVATLKAQLDDMVAHGVRSVCVHPFPVEFRPGRFQSEMSPEYLSPEYMEVFAQVVDHMETDGVSDVAIAEIPADIVANQSLAIDVITGATLSSKGLLMATENALASANADVTALKARKQESAPGELIEKTADVVVVGGGGAGISAAIAAASEGASVVLIEKGSMLGGNTLYSGGAWNAVDPELQGKKETEPGMLETLQGYLDEDESTYGEFAPTLQALKQEITDYLAGDTTYMFDSLNLHIIQCYQGGLRQDLDGNWYHGDFELIKKLCESSLDSINWTKEWGIEWNDTISFVYGSLWARGHSNKCYLGSGYFKYGKPYAEQLGVDIMLKTAGKELVVEDGRVTGVKA